MWNVIGKWGARLIGIGSTLILVRLIEPAAFGLVALATICIGFVETFTSFGINRYLIVHTDLNDKALNSGWTLSILLKLLVTLVLVLFSGILAELLNEVDVQPVILVIAISGFFASFNNIGLVKYERELNYRKMVSLGLICKVFSTIVTISIALIYPNHWALVAGGITATFIYLFGSYVIHEYRPKLNFQFDVKQFSFSFYLVIRSVVGYGRNKLDVLFVSKFFNAASVGKYNIGLEFATLPFNEMIAPASSAMFPGLSKFKDNKLELLDKTYKYLALVYLLILPSIVGVWIVAPQFCPVILGDKWADVSPIMSSLAVLMLPYSLLPMLHNLFDFNNMTKHSLYIDVLALIILLSCFIAIDFENFEAFAYIRGWLGGLVFVLLIVYARIFIGFSLRRMAEILIVPTLASLLMFSSFEFVYVQHDISLVGLFVNVMLGGVYYLLSIVPLLYIAKSKSQIWAFWYDKALSLASNNIHKFRFKRG
jgi:lipopolysaccharide exporter